jgi:hypothetical protein
MPRGDGSQSWRAVRLFMLLVAGAVRADPWLEPGDEALRHDITLLADAGLLRGPVTTWPLSWPDVARDLEAATVQDLDPDLVAVVTRVRALAHDASDRGFSGVGLRASAATDVGMFRSFADSPRDDAEATVRTAWLGDHLSLELQVTVVADPADGKRVRADGSHVALSLGNLMVSAGYVDHWWGPGWENSLILSTNARPVPGLSIERNYSDPFRSRWLSWIGPWRAGVSIGETEQSGVTVGGVRFIAARVNFRPRPWLELGLSRSAQWCGDGRPCDLDSLTDLVLGRDNVVDDVTGSVSEQPGNQLAGYDVRLRSPWRALPMALYGQLIGEDEAGGLPSKFLGLMGAELWGVHEHGAWRIHVEYSDTTCSFSRRQPEFDCAYRNLLYPQGYTHRGRGLGSSMGGDSRMTSLGGHWTARGGDSWSLGFRRIEINRDGGPHPISESPRRVNDVELRYSRNLGIGSIQVAVARDHGDPINDDNTGARGFVTWQQGF